MNIFAYLLVLPLLFNHNMANIGIGSQTPMYATNTSGVTPYGYKGTIQYSAPIGPGLGYNNDYAQFNKQGTFTGVTTKPTNTGGGGGGPAPKPAPTPVDNNYMGSGMSQDQYMGEINNAYNPSYDALNQQEASTRAGEQNFYDQFTKPYDAQEPLLKQAYNSGVNLNKQQQTTNEQNKLNAIDSNRRLYNELAQGVHQRFGGANSAGEFANAFYGREFQRQMGNTQNTAGQNQQALLAKLQDIQGEFDAKMQSLTMQKAAALAQAKDAFQQRLDAINNARIGLDQNKAQLKLQALQEFRQRAYQVQDQANQLAQQLQLIHAQNGTALKTAYTQYGNSANTPTQTNPYAAAQYPLMNQQATAQTQVVGNVQPQNTSSWDKYGLFPSY